MKKIPLTQGKFATVDDDDYDFLSQWKWHFSKGYAARKPYTTVDGKYVTIARQLLGQHGFSKIAYLDGNKLNCQRSNLIETVKTQYLGKAKKRKGTTSRYKGVTWNEKNQCWIAQRGGYIGSYQDEWQAAKAYNEVAEKHFGIFAKLNGVD